MVRSRAAIACAAALAAGVLMLCTGTADAQKGGKPPSTPEKIAFSARTSANGPWYVFTVNTDGTGKTQLTSGRTYGSSGPDWSPDLNTSLAGYQGKIAYRGDSYWGNNLFTMDPNGANKTQITTFGGISRVYMSVPKWSPDGRYIAFSVEGRNPEYNPDNSEAGLWVYGPIDGTPALSRVWFDDSLYMLGSVCWLPDLDANLSNGYQGKILVFARNPASNDANTGIRAFSVSISPGGPVVFDSFDLTIVSRRSLIDISRMPDGSLRAAWGEWVTGSTMGIMVAPVTVLATGALSIGAGVNVTPAELVQSRARWSSDGTRLVYDAAPPGSDPGTYIGTAQQIYTIVVPASLEGLGTPANPYPAPTALTNDHGWNYLAAWSPKP